MTSLARRFALLLLSFWLVACGPLPDLGGVELVACGAVPGAECVSAEENACGWRRVERVASIHPEAVSTDGHQLMAPAGRASERRSRRTGDSQSPGPSHVKSKRPPRA